LDICRGFTTLRLYFPRKNGHVILGLL
jgi:hypothetical protein